MSDCRLPAWLVLDGSTAAGERDPCIAALADHHFDIAIIPKTWDFTNLSTLSPGDPVNLEADVIAKYVERMMEGR